MIALLVTFLLATVAAHSGGGRGNLVSDGVLFYQYDAWGRLVQVWEVGELEFDEWGEVEGGEPDAWIAHFSYDGLGRLIRKASRFDALHQRTEHYYYDGVRRIQETITDPILGSDDEALAMEDEEEDEGLQYLTWVDREYVHSPDYVDEYVAQIDLSGQNERIAYVVQDANYNVVALLDDAGEVMARYVWDPYGQLLYANLYGGQQFRNRIGHQGLFFDRLDALATADQLVVGGVGLYQNRNRVYNPFLGRFHQRDPNGSGVPVLSSMAMHGGVIAPGSVGFDGEAMYADGMSLHAYVSSNPGNRTDPAGLFGGLGGALGTSANMAGIAADGMHHAALGVSLQMTLFNMIEGYSFDQEMDLEWAGDWELDDADHSRNRRVESDLHYDGSSVYNPWDLTAARGTKGLSSRLKGVSRGLYKARARQFERMKKSIWKKEARRNPDKYSEDQLRDMHAGRAPKGDDNARMVIHHRRPLKDGGRNYWGNFEFMTRGEHRRRNKELHWEKRW